MTGPHIARPLPSAALALALCALSPKPGAAVPSPAGRLFLSEVSPDLSDATLDLVVSRAGGPIEARVYVTPDAPKIVATTALFLARSYVALCKTPHVVVRLVRTDLAWPLVGRDVPDALTVVADAEVLASDESHVRASRRPPPKKEVEAALKKAPQSAAATTLAWAAARELYGAEDAPAYTAVAATIRGSCRGYDGETRPR